MINLLDVLFLVASGYQAIPPSDHVEWEEHRFAFLPGIFLDLEQGIEVNADAGSRFLSVRNCSKMDQNCLTGSTFNVVWSKTCGPYEVGQKWSASAHDGTTTEFQVVRRVRLKAHLFDFYEFVVTSSFSDDVAYVFTTGQGLVGLLQDPRKEGTLVNYLSSSKVPMELGGDFYQLDEKYVFSRLAGTTPLGECAPMESIIKDGVKVFSAPSQ